MSEIFEALEGTADGAFVVDEQLRIQFWNEPAEKIMGFGNGDVIGQKCYRILQGSDEQSRLICKACCQVAHSALKSEPVPNYDMRVNTNQGDERWLNMSVITPKMGRNGAQKVIVHLFRDISHKKDDEILFRRILDTAQRYQNISFVLDNEIESNPLVERLTKREREVLALLARSLSTQEIAEALFISPNTARNHIQRILQKLNVHSRLEAVTYTLNKGLLS